MGPSSHATITLPQAPGPQLLEARPDGAGLRLGYAGTDLGRIEWALIVRPAGDVDHAAELERLDLRFAPPARHALYTEFRAKSGRSRFTVTVTARAWDAGFLDIAADLHNVSAERTRGMYAALVARWEHPAAARRMLCHDNREPDFDAFCKTHFSAGEGRHWALQHGLVRLAGARFRPRFRPGAERLRAALHRARGRALGPQ